MLLLLLPAVSSLQTFIASRQIELELSGKRSCRSGGDMELKLTLLCGGIRPSGRVYVQLELENRVFGSVETQTLVLESIRRGKNVYDIPFDSTYCGLRTVSVKKSFCCGVLGLISFPSRSGQSFICTVYPFESKMHADISRHVDREQYGEIYDDRRSGMDVSEVFGLREYREGDSLQSIHWKLSGKLNQLIVREFGRPINYHTLLLTDPAPYINGEPVSKELINAVFDLTASLSQALLDRDIAHFVGYMQNEQLEYTPVESDSSYQNMLMRLMDSPISGEAHSALYTFWELQLYNRFTKIIYISAASPENAIHYISGEVNLTVLTPVEDKSAYFGGDGYEHISISTKDIRSQEHIISI